MNIYALDINGWVALVLLEVIPNLSTSIYFLQVDPEQHTLAKYLMELTLIEYTFVTYLPSKIAAAALFLSIKLLDKDHKAPWVRLFSLGIPLSFKCVIKVFSKIQGLVGCVFLQP